MRRLFVVPQNKDLKRLVRARMAETGELYTVALAAIMARTRLEPVPAPWFMAGSRPADYEVGLLPAAVTHEGSRVVQLRLRAGTGNPVGFGTLMQSIAPTRYLTRRVRFSATVRTVEVADWAGLWMRVDASDGNMRFDNMQGRPLRESTDWTPPAIVLDVPETAVGIHFGVLLHGAGALELCRARFEEVDESVPTTDMGPSGPLPEEPRALDFGTVG